MTYEGDMQSKMVFLLPNYDFLTFIMFQSMGSSTVCPPMFNLELCGRPFYIEHNYLRK
jgi:hypothetical protein